jgi:hypothetical protein
MKSSTNRSLLNESGGGQLRWGSLLGSGADKGKTTPQRKEEACPKEVTGIIFTLPPKHNTACSSACVQEAYATCMIH